VTTAFLFAIVSAAATSAPAADADLLIRKGLDLRKEGRDREALVLLQQAVEQERTPRALAQLGTCEQALGLWPSAEQHLDEALKSPGDAWIKKNGKLLQDAVTFVKGKVGSLEVWGTPAGAAVTVDDAPVGTLPLGAPVRVGEGRRTITVEAPGYVADTRTVEVRGGSAIREHIALARAAVAHAAPVVADVTTLPRAISSTDGATPIPPITSSAPPQPLSLDRASEDRFYRTWWFWTLVGTAVVAGGVTTYLVLRNNNDGCVPQMGAPCW
jgi:hypothetical protein